MLTQASQGIKSFTYDQRNSSNKVTIKEIKWSKNNSLNYNLIIKGRDRVGTWKAEGGYLMTEQGPLFWMLKFYDDSERAGQTGRWQVLVYESTNIQ